MTNVDSNGLFLPLTPIDPIILRKAKLHELIVCARALPPDPTGETLRAFIDSVLPSIAWSERYVSRKGIKTKPAEDAGLRHCTRVVSMVHELHKVGYQKIRAIPQESPSGAHWRCNITYSSNVAADGYKLIDFDIEDRGLVAHYTSADGAAYFGWTDAHQLNARELAALFLERFPEIAQNGQGRDWLYAGWLTDFLGLMENADELGLLAFTGDYPVDPKKVDPWLPPPPR